MAGKPPRPEIRYGRALRAKSKAEGKPMVALAVNGDLTDLPWVPCSAEFIGVGDEELVKDLYSALVRYTERIGKRDRGAVVLPVLNHAPRYQYDCDRCKFSWCCGPTCVCVLASRTNLPEPPRERQDEVDAALVKAGYAPQFRGEGAQRR